MLNPILTPDFELRTLPLPLDEVLLQAQTGFQGKVIFWGERAGEISSYVAGWLAGKGINVIVLDGANRFDPYVVSSFARTALLSPEDLLKRIHIARAFTCYQMAALIGEKLILLFKEGGAEVPPKRPWVILLGFITTFLDEDIPERGARLLFERSIKRIEEMALKGVPFLLFQSNSFHGFSSFPTFAKAGKKGLRDLRRNYFMKRLFQFSNLVWRVSLDDEGLKVILEKRSPSLNRGEMRSSERNGLENLIKRGVVYGKNRYSF